MTAILSIFILLPLAIFLATGSFSVGTVASILIVCSVGTLCLVLLGRLIEQMGSDGDPAHESQ